MTNFNDIFKSSFMENVSSFSLTDTLIGLAFAFAVGMYIFFVYKKSFTGVMYSQSFALTLPSLAMVTALVIMAVTSNVVLSLGMVGALSIVRFRTAIKEPMEIVFLFWAIAAGIVIGAGMIPLVVCGSVILGIFILVMSNKKTSITPYIIVVNCADEASEQRASQLITNSTDKFVVKSKTVRADNIELTAEIRLKDSSTSFVNEICKADGVKDAVLVSYNGEYMS